MKYFIAAASLLLSGCLGYQIGPVKPSVLKDVHDISVPVFTNRTLLPRIEVLVTGTVIKQLQQDGTFRIVEGDNADATLKAEIVEVTRNPARSLRENVLATIEYNLAMHVRYTLVGRSGAVLMGPADVIGNTSFFVGTDVTTDERQALPLAAEELAQHLVTQLSEGW
ncbi:MAG: LptE family protein [Verrucomicrobia bacterium]|nr:LptE family protein [Verrucomicrobiota bacterium]